MHFSETLLNNAYQTVTEFLVEYGRSQENEKISTAHWVLNRCGVFAKKSGDTHGVRWVVTESADARNLQQAIGDFFDMTPYLKKSPDVPDAEEVQIGPKDILRMEETIRRYNQVKRVLPIIDTALAQHNHVFGKPVFALYLPKRGKIFASAPCMSEDVANPWQAIMAEDLGVKPQYRFADTGMPHLLLTYSDLSHITGYKHQAALVERALPTEPARPLKKSPPQTQLENCLRHATFKWAPVLNNRVRLLVLLETQAQANALLIACRQLKLWNHTTSSRAIRSSLYNKYEIDCSDEETLALAANLRTHAPALLERIQATETPAGREGPDWKSIAKKSPDRTIV